MAIDRTRHAAPGSLPWTDCCFCWAPGASAGKRAHQKNIPKPPKKYYSNQKKSVVSPTAATFYFYRSFWSVLRSQALETPSPEPCWTWPGFAPRPPRPSPEPSPKPVELDLALHQGFLEPSPEPSPEPYWTWPGSALKPPRPSPPCWTWPGCTKASQTFSGTLLKLTWLCTKASRPSPGTFSETLLNLTWLHQSLPDLLRNFLRNPVEPDLSLQKASQTFTGTF